MALEGASRDIGAETVVPPVAMASANPLTTAKLLEMDRGFMV